MIWFRPQVLSHSLLVMTSMSDFLRVLAVLLVAIYEKKKKKKKKKKKQGKVRYMLTFKLCLTNSNI